MYNKTIIITLIASFKITKTLLHHNIIVYLINFTKEMQHVFINNTETLQQIPVQACQKI